MTDRRASRPAQLLPYALEVVAVLALFAAAGVGCGWLWFHVWSQPTGTVFEHVWYADEEGLRDVFDGTAWYVVFAAAGGAADRRAGDAVRPTVAAGDDGRGAGRQCARCLADAPDRPGAEPARTRRRWRRPPPTGPSFPDGCRSRAANSPYLAWPLGSLIVLMVLNFLLSSGDRIKDREDADPRWLSRNQPG